MPEATKGRGLSRRAALWRGGTLLAGGTLAASPRARAQDAAGYPDRPIRFVIPAPPGGPSDVLMRLIRPHLQASLGQTVILENRPSSGGMIGMGAVARAVPDGHTLVLATSVMVINPSLFRSSTYDPIADFAPVAELATAQNVFLVRRDSPLRTLADLLSRARAAPGTLNYASPGIGTTPHLAGELLKAQASIDIVHVPFLGVNPAIAALLAGTTELAALALPPAMPHLREGTLRALAVTGAARWPDLPEVETVGQAGVPGFLSDTFQALLAPAGTPPAIVERLAREVSEAVLIPEVRARLGQIGFTVEPKGPEALRRRIGEEVVMYRELIQRAGIRAE
jgi:tripartite-type tricarboxylate transporter receptor subunit TctC